MKLKTNILSVILLFVVNLVSGQKLTFTTQKVAIDYPGSTLISLTSINDSGYVAGTLRLGSGDVNFFYDFKKVTIIPFLPNYDRAGGVSINNKGQAAGSNSSTSGIDPWVKGFFYDNGSLTGIGTLGGNHIQITGINNSGALSGYSSNGSSYHAVLYENGTLKDLGTVAHNFSRGAALNDSNFVVGWSNVVPGENNIYHAFIYKHNQMLDIGTLPGDNISVAAAINDSNYVVGQSENNNTIPFSVKAFVWYGSGAMVHLPEAAGMTNSTARDINNNNLIVGSCSNSTITIPVIWIDGKVYPINDLIEPGSGIEITQLVAINNQNQIICAVASSGTGFNNWYILSPKNSDFIVNMTSDESDFDLNDEVADVDPDIPGDQTTLRAAIQQANHNPGKDKIIFNIPGDPNPTLQINSPLPVITEEVEIDGLQNQ